MAKWFNADAPIAQKYSIAFYNLPEETDAPALIRMLSLRGIKECELAEVEKVDATEKSSNDRPAKSNLKRKLSFKLSCKSEEEMKHAIRTIKSNDGLDLDVSALVSENLPSKVPEENHEVSNEHAQKEKPIGQ